MQHLDTETIRELEMTHGEYKFIPTAYLQATQALLETLRRNPNWIRVIQKSDAEGKQQFRLEIRDPAFAAGQSEEKSEARMDFYREGLYPLLATVLGHFPNIPPETDLLFARDPQRGCVMLGSTLKLKATAERTLPPDRMEREPVHIIAKYLADNGVNFPGSSHFQQMQGRA